jgi:hypothetical protein
MDGGTTEDPTETKDTGIPVSEAAESESPTSMTESESPTSITDTGTTEDEGTTSDDTPTAATA